MNKTKTYLELEKLCWEENRMYILEYLFEKKMLQLFKQR